MDNQFNSRRRGWAANISILAVLPLLFLQIIFLVDIRGWYVSFGYGLIVFVAPLLAVYLLAFLAMELYLRRRHQSGFQRFPWFTPLVAAALVTFFFAGEWARSVVLLNPQWCRVHQVVKWNMTKGNLFVLVVSGRGNCAHHDFSSGYLNWSGQEPAGISDIELTPMRFGSWNGYEHVFVDATPNELRNRLAPAGLSEAQLASLTIDVWDVLQQFSTGKPITSPTGNVQPVRDDPFGHEHDGVGGIIWMAVFLVLFLAIGQWSLTRPMPTVAKQQPART